MKPAITAASESKKPYASSLVSKAGKGPKRYSVKRAAATVSRCDCGQPNCKELSDPPGGAFPPSDESHLRGSGGGQGTAQQDPRKGLVQSGLLENCVLPETPDPVLIENLIVADDGQIFGLGLGDQHAVEGIFMMAWKESGAEAVIYAYG
jgi:hypothetical protein